MYIPPNSPILTYQTHLKAIESLRDIDSTIIIVGDFNLPSILWLPDDDDQRFIPTNLRSESSIFTCDSLFAEGFSQINNTTNRSGNVLDLVFVNDYTEVKIMTATRCLSNIDEFHYPFELFIRTTNQTNNKTASTNWIYCFQKSNFTALNEYLDSLDFVEHFSNDMDIDAAVEGIYDILHNGFELFVPTSIENYSQQ